MLTRIALYCFVSLCISQLHSSFPTSISGQPIFLSASEAIASGKWIWWILSGKQHLSDCQILGEETEVLRSWFRARNTCPWGPSDGGRRLAKCDAELLKLHFLRSFPFWQNVTLVSKGKSSHVLKCLNCWSCFVSPTKAFCHQSPPPNTFSNVVSLEGNHSN